LDRINFIFSRKTFTLTENMAIILCMRVNSGRFRGKTLSWISGDTTRPTTDRVKENVFNVLMSMGVEFDGARVLDAFAGSGQMGIECISRGASLAVFCDTSDTARAVIKKNLTSIGFGSKAQIVPVDCLRCLRDLSAKSPLGQFDIVFLDPPYSDPEICLTATAKLIENDLLSPNSVVVVETETENLEFPNYDVKQKKYGRAVIFFLTIQSG